MSAAARYMLGWPSVPRSAVTTLEGTAPEVTPLTANETTITTALEHGLLAIWPLNMARPS